MMKRTMRSIAGVTLLEIMLVLAIAAMIIVMSVRYYQSAQAKQQATDTIQKLTAIMSAADSMSIASGSYAAFNNAALEGALANVGGNTTPWGGTITVAPAASTYTVTVTDVPPQVCSGLYGQLNGNRHISAITTCTASVANFNFTYNMQEVAST